MAEELYARLDKYLIADDVELHDESMDDEAFITVPNETRRILDGIPKWPNEITPGILPPEANLEERSISYTKGCYTGQEVISRMKRAGKTNRHLVKLSSTSPSSQPLPNSWSMARKQASSPPSPPTLDTEKSPSVPPPQVRRP